MSQNIDWNDVIKKEARGVNDEDFGEVQDISNGYVFLQKGIINKEKFFIPQEKVESYDGNKLRFNLSKNDILQYRGDSVPALSPTMQESTSTSPISQNNEIEEQTVPVMEEKLDVNKKVEETQATVTKRPVTNTKTVEVPVTHEEISIERRQPTGSQQDSNVQKPIHSEENIHIPLKRETVDVSKTPYVKEELVIKKEPVTETKKITSEVQSESIETNNL